VPTPRTRRRTTAGLTIALTGATLVATAAPATADDDASPLTLAPYYTEADLTGDAQVGQDDVDLLVRLLGTTTTSPHWAKIAPADADGDGVATLTDVAGLAQRMVYDDGPFELLEASTLDMQAAMNAGVTTSVAITQEYIDRIAAYDRTVVPGASRALNSVLAVSDAALAAAADSDARRAAGQLRGPLDGVPVLAKDNYDTFDMPTTAGCSCWDANRTADDAFMVDGLRDEGAVVLGKASMDEFAFGFVSEFSSGRPAGSSLLVASPYVTSRTAGGSSGGTGAAIAANLGAVGLGTDTGGSIRVPSSYNQLVGVRPTVGLTSRDGIVPLALSQDTGGPMTRTVADAAAALDAMVGVDPADPVTARQEGLVPESYTSFLDPGALEGARIGYVPAMVGSNRTTTRLFADAVATLEAAGATVVPVTPPQPAFGAVLNEPSGSTNEFKHDLAQYVERHLSPDVEHRTLAEILASGRYVPSRAGTYAQRDAVTPEQYAAWAGPDGTHTRALATGKQVVTGMLDDLGLDALIYPSGTPYGTQGTNMRLSPNTGMPAVTVPMGRAVESDGTIAGAGVNLELLGRDFSEGTLLGLAYAYEQLTHHRTAPVLYPEVD
jgi:Asp-tRNA(Asn)/Glu-tRNA(Gln) amidotransferase A subunit family amidase